MLTAYCMILQVSRQLRSSGSERSPNFEEPLHRRNFLRQQSERLRRKRSDSRTINSNFKKLGGPLIRVSKLFVNPDNFLMFSVHTILRRITVRKRCLFAFRQTSKQSTLIIPIIFFHIRYRWFRRECINCKGNEYYRK